MIRYNNQVPNRQTHTEKPSPPPSYGQSHFERSAPHSATDNKKDCNKDHKKGEGVKNPLKFLPKEIYNPKTHKFFGKLSGEDILIIGLILMILDSGCDEDLLLALALLYILLSDWIDFGNILS